MSKIDWTKRRLFSDIPGQADSDLVEIYIGEVSTAIPGRDWVYMATWKVYVVPNRAIFGGSGEDGWIFMINDANSVGYSPSKVYKTLPQCLKQAEKSFLASVAKSKSVLENTNIH